jgi:hypothetical protein
MFNRMSLRQCKDGCVTFFPEATAATMFSMRARSDFGCATVPAEPVGRALLDPTEQTRRNASAGSRLALL